MSCPIPGVEQTATFPLVDAVAATYTTAGDAPVAVVPSSTEVCCRRATSVVGSCWSYEAWTYGVLSTGPATELMTRHCAWYGR